MRPRLIVVALVLGCGPLIDDADDGIAETTSGATTGAIAESMTTASGGGIDDGTPPPQTTAPPDPSATMSGTSPPPDPSDTGIGDDVTTDAPGTAEAEATTAAPSGPCDLEADDNACQVCRKEACCAELTECVASPDCACVLECLDLMEMPGVPEAMSCADECAVDFLEIVPPIVAIDMCQQDNCAGPCGG